MQEVRRKRDAWKAHTSTDLGKFLAQHMVPTIIGLGGRHYLIDHHHLALALHEEGVESVFVTVAADLSRLPEDHFWNMMDLQGLDPSIRWQRGQASLRRPSRDGRRHGGRPLPLARRRLARERRLRQGFRRRSPSSCGRTSFGGESRPSRSRRISTQPWPRRCAWRRAARPTTCPDGVAPTPTRPPPPQKPPRRSARRSQPPETTRAGGRLVRRPGCRRPDVRRGEQGFGIPSSFRGASGKLRKSLRRTTFGVSWFFLEELQPCGRGGRRRRRPRSQPVFLARRSVEPAAGSPHRGAWRRYDPAFASREVKPTSTGRAPRRGPAGRRQRGSVRLSRRLRPPRW